MSVMKIFKRERSPTDISNDTHSTLKFTEDTETPHRDESKAQKFLFYLPLVGAGILIACAAVSFHNSRDSAQNPAQSKPKECIVNYPGREETMGLLQDNRRMIRKADWIKNDLAKFDSLLAEADRIQARSARIIGKGKKPDPK